MTADQHAAAQAVDPDRAGLPIVMVQATGPGHDRVLPRHGRRDHRPTGAGRRGRRRPRAPPARRHAGVGYDWYDSGIWYSTSGRDPADTAPGPACSRWASTDRATTTTRNAATRPLALPGGPVPRPVHRRRPARAVLIAAGGNAFIRDLAEGETILVKPPALLFKDPTVAMQMHVEYPHAGMKFWRSWGNRYLWLRLWGPGRVGLESPYDRRGSRHRLPQHLAVHPAHLVAPPRRSDHRRALTRRRSNVQGVGRKSSNSAVSWSGAWTGTQWSQPSIRS